MSRRRWMDLAALLALAFAGWKFGLPAPRWFDLPAFDEARYLDRGVRLLELGVNRLSGQWSPLYSLWYFVLYQITHVPRIPLHDLNFRLLPLLLSGLLFLVLRSRRVAFWPAFGLSLYTLTAEMSWVTDTRVTTFALALVLVGGWYLERLPRGWPRWLWATGWLALVAYARPEYTLAAGILAVTGLAFAVRARELPSWRAVWPWGVLAGMPLLLALGAWWLWGPALGSRSMYAFGQHYAYTRWQCLKQPHRGHSWEDEVRADFGSAQNILQALLANPRAFWSHVWCNLQSFPPRLAWVVFHHATVLLPGYPVAEALLVAGAVLVFAGWRVARQGTRLWLPWKEAPEALFYWMAVAGVGLFVLTVIHGAKRYYLIQLAWPLVVLTGSMFLPQETRDPELGWALSGLLVAIALVPPMGHLFATPYCPPVQTNRALLQMINTLPLPRIRPVRWASARGLRHYFLKLYLERPVEALPYAPEQGFLEYLQNTQPDLLTVDVRWYTGDEGWARFRRSPEKFGYQMRRFGRDILVFYKPITAARP